MAGELFLCKRHPDLVANRADDEQAAAWSAKRLTGRRRRRRRRGRQHRGRNVRRKPAFGRISPEVDHRYIAGPELGDEVVMAHAHVPANTAVWRCLTWAPSQHVDTRVRVGGTCAEPKTGQREAARHRDRRQASQNSIHGTKPAPAGGLKHGEFTPYLPALGSSSPNSTSTSTRSPHSSTSTGRLGADIQNLLELTGIQQDLLDLVLGLVGSLGGMFTG